MACFLVSAAEAVAVKGIEKHERKIEEERMEKGEVEVEITKVPLSRKLRWLTWMLWGGSALLLFEHIWHGEIVAWFPFLTAMADPADKAAMLHEMATVGVAMAAVVTFTWLIMCKAADAILSRKTRAGEEA